MNKQDIEIRALYWIQLMAEITHTGNSPEEISKCCRNAIKVLKSIKGEIYECNGIPQKLEPIIESLKEIEQQNLALAAVKIKPSQNVS
jgi:hypothetical protein